MNIAILSSFHPHPQVLVLQGIAEQQTGSYTGKAHSYTAQGEQQLWFGQPTWVQES